MSLDLDILAALVCGALAVTLFTLHQITSRRYQDWVTLPEHLRIGLVLAGVMFMWRSVNLLSLPSLESRGHANAESVLSGAVLLYCLIGTAVWVAQTFQERRAGLIDLTSLDLERGLNRRR